MVATVCPPVSIPFSACASWVVGVLARWGLGSSVIVLLQHGLVVRSLSRCTLTLPAGSFVTCSYWPVNRRPMYKDPLHTSSIDRATSY